MQQPPPPHRPPYEASPKQHAPVAQAGTPLTLDTGANSHSSSPYFQPTASMGGQTMNFRPFQGSPNLPTTLPAQQLQQSLGVGAAGYGHPRPLMQPAGVPTSMVSSNTGTLAAQSIVNGGVNSQLGTSLGPTAPTGPYPAMGAYAARGSASPMHHTTPGFMTGPPQPPQELRPAYPSTSYHNQASAPSQMMPPEMAQSPVQRPQLQQSQYVSPQVRPMGSTQPSMTSTSPTSLQGAPMQYYQPQQQQQQVAAEIMPIAPLANIGTVSPPVTARHPTMMGYSQAQASGMMAPQHPTGGAGPGGVVYRPQTSSATGSVPPPQVAPPSGASSKINPAAMPNVIAVQEADQAKYMHEGDLFRSSSVTNVLPPLTTTDVPILDDGNCSSRMMRLTSYHIPVSEDLAYSSRLPVSLIIQPFARAHLQEAPVPLVDPGERGPIRCTRCRSYINPFVAFVRGGRSFQCNICGMVNDVPDDYYCQLDHTGRRSDVNERPELLFGAVDFVASKEYIMRTPVAPYLLLSIDCSRAAIQNGSFSTGLRAIRELVEEAVSSPCCGKMAIITFDKSIQVYDMRAAEPQILVMSDVHEPFVPLSDGLFFDPVQAKERVLALLDRLPGLVSETRVIDSCLGAATAFGLEALRRHGGRVVLFASTLPSIGLGMLKNRDGSASAASTDKVNPLHLPQNDYYTKVGKDAATLGISFCIVSTPSAYIDIATIGQLATLTNGKILHYSRFNSDFSGRTLVQDLKTLLQKPFIFDSIVRVRAGSSLQTGEYFGNYSTLNQTDYQFATIDCDQSFAVTFFYDGKLDEREKISFQCAVLHTTAQGQRRIRVLNLAASVSSQLASIFRMADLEALLQFSTKRAISQLSSTPLPTLVQHIHIRSAQILASYRKNCAATMPSGQLVLPESLKLLPVYCLALSKTTAFSQGTDHSLTPN